MHSDLAYHFKDGSLDEKISEFTHRSVYHLVRDHHIQRGPFFSKDTDYLIEGNGNVTVSTTERNGKKKTENSQITLPANISNGLLSVVLLNAAAKPEPVKSGLVIPFGKGRLIQLSITADRKEAFSPMRGANRTATVLRIHPELGGVLGAVAPIVGKEPKDRFAWVLEGEVPTLVRQVTTLEEGGP